MKCIARYALLATAALMLIAARAGTAATHNPRTMFSFCKNTDCSGGDNPQGLVRGPDGAYYGVAQTGGIQGGYPGGSGTVYRFDPTTRSIGVVHKFDPELEGGQPGVSLTLGSDGNFYGVLGYGALDASGHFVNLGCLFRLSPTGEFTSLHAFALDGSEGGAARYPPVEDGLGNWYGATVGGGLSNGGTIYEYTHDGIFQKLHDFSSCSGNPPDGCDPNGLVLASDGNFYGTTYVGGIGGEGTIFRVAPDGTFATVHSFTGNEGAFLTGTLVNGPDGALYGVSGSGGTLSVGSMFRYSLQGQFSLLYSFPYSGIGGPSGGLTLMPDGYFYGVRKQGGPWGDGLLYRISPSGSNYRPLYFFGGAEDGGLPYPGLLGGFDNALYGTTLVFGKYGQGTVFRYMPPPVQ